MIATTFYSYDSLVRQGNLATTLRFAFIIIGAIFILGYVIFHLRHRDVAKYRDLLVIIIVAVLLLIGIQVVDIEQNQSANRDSRAAVTLLESIARTKRVHRDQVTFSATTVYTGMLVQFKHDRNQTYTLTLDPDGQSYQLTKTTLIDQ